MFTLSCDENYPDVDVEKNDTAIGRRGGIRKELNLSEWQKQYIRLI